MCSHMIKPYLKNVLMQHHVHGMSQLNFSTVSLIALSKRGNEKREQIQQVHSVWSLHRVEANSLWSVSHESCGEHLLFDSLNESYKSPLH